jgi:hypothetical protein
MLNGFEYKASKSQRFVAAKALSFAALIVAVAFSWSFLSVVFFLLLAPLALVFKLASTAPRLATVRPAGTVRGRRHAAASLSPREF